MTVREGTDVNNLRVGDVIGRVWDEDTREDSCHCSIVCTITLDVVGPLAVGVRTVEVVSHNLLDGDIVRGCTIDGFEVSEGGLAECLILTLG